MEIYTRKREERKEKGSFFLLEKDWEKGEKGERQWIFIVGAGLPHVPFTVWSMEVEVVAFFVCFCNGVSCSSDRIRSI